MAARAHPDRWWPVPESVGTSHAETNWWSRGVFDGKELVKNVRGGTNGDDEMSDGCYHYKKKTT